MLASEDPIEVLNQRRVAGRRFDPGFGCQLQSRRRALAKLVEHLVDPRHRLAKRDHLLDPPQRSKSDEPRFVDRTQIVEETLDRFEECGGAARLVEVLAHPDRVAQRVRDLGFVRKPGPQRASGDTADFPLQHEQLVVRISQPGADTGGRVLVDVEPIGVDTPGCRHWGDGHEWFVSNP